MGAQEYGPKAFLNNDMFRFIAEELADISNYCLYFYIKLRLWEEMLTGAYGVDIGPQAFTPADKNTKPGQL